jgi:hypothetical protein
LTIWRVLSILVIALTVGSAAAEGRLDALATAVERETSTPRAEGTSVERMARFLGVSVEELRVEHGAARLGWADVFISHRIATRGGHPLEKVFAARRSGAAWAQIAEEAGVDVDALVHDLAAVWPDAVGARSAPDPTGPGGSRPSAVAPAAAPPADDKKGLGGRVLDLLRGGTVDTPDGSRDDKPVDRTSEDIRDRMIRGGGRSR